MPRALVLVVWVFGYTGGKQPDGSAAVGPQPEQRLHHGAGKRRREDQPAGIRVREVPLRHEKRQQRRQHTAREVDSAPIARRSMSARAMS